jgi:RHS repeat-associated protein
MSNRILGSLLIGCVSLLVPLCSAQSFPPTISWISDSDGFWDDSSNWLDTSGKARVPSSTDDVLIDRASHPTVTIQTCNNHSVHSVVSTSPLVIAIPPQFTCGGLSTAAASELDAGFTLNNATLSLGGPLTLKGNSNWQSGSIIGSGAVTNTGTITLSGAGGMFLGVVLNNSGTIAHQGGNLQLDIFINFVGGFTGTLNNTGLYDIQGDVTISHQFSDAALVNNTGTFRKSAGAGVATLGLFGIPFNNNGGTIDAESGILVIQGGTHTGGTFMAGSANGVQAMLQFTGSQTFTGTYTGSGTGIVQLNGPGAPNKFVIGPSGATFNFPPGLLQWKGGIIDGGSAGLTNLGTFTLVEGGSHAILENNITNAGSFVQSGVSTLGIGGATFTNLPGAIFDFQGDGGVVNEGSPNAFINQGIVRKSMGTLSPFLASGFNNTDAGTIDVRSGTLAISSGNSTGGVFTVAADAILDLTGGTVPNLPTPCSSTYSGTYTGSGQGTVLMSGCILTIGPTGATFNFPPGLFQWTGGLIAGGAGALTNVGTMTLSGTGGKFLGTVLNNSGTIVHQGGNLQLDYFIAFVGGFTGTLNNNSLYDIQGDGTFSRQFADASAINNNGTFRKSAGTGTTGVNFSLPFNNMGTVEVHSGTFTLTSTPQITGNVGNNTLTGGVWNVFANSTLNLPGTVTTNQAQVALDGRGATFPTINALNNNSGTFSVLDGAGFTTASSLTNSGSIILGTASKLNVTGNYSQTSAASLSTQIGGRPITGQFGQFSSTGSVTLNGTFDATLVNGFGVTSGDSYTVMNFASHAGTFSTIAGLTSGRFSLLSANLTSTTLTLSTTQTESDLAMGAISIVTPSAKPGQNVSISYTVNNLGSVPATGDWFDSVFLSTSQFIDSTAVRLGDVHHTGDVAAGGSYTATLQAPLPPLLARGYYAIAVADSRGLVPDANRNNNTGTSTGTLAVSIPLLSLGTPLTDMIANAQDSYYHLVLPPAADVTLSAAFSVLPEAAIYVRYGQLPDQTVFDLSTISDLANANPKLAENNTQGGDYYILVHGLSGAGAGQSFTLKANLSQLQVLSISPQAALNNPNETINLTGTEFTRNTGVNLVAADGTVYHAGSLSFTDSTRLAATFDLSQVSLDSICGCASLTVRATDGSQTATASTLLRVSNALTLSFSFARIMTPAEVRVGASIGMTIEVDGLPDAFTPVPFIEVDASNVAAGQEREQFVDPTIPRFLAPGGSLQFGFGYDPEPHAAGVVSGFDLELISLTQPIDWDSQKGSLQPSGVAADAWDAIWANLRPGLGSTVGDFYSLLGQDSAALFVNGVATTRVSRLLRFEVAKANDQWPLQVVEPAVDLAFPAPGVPLQFARVPLGSSIAGRYHLGRLGRGWVDTYDTSAITDSITHWVTIQQGPVSRSFAPNGDGSYTGPPGDFGKLTLAGGVYQLRETTGATTVFNPDGSLNFIQDVSDNRITAGYSGGMLTSLTHSDGSVMILSYNAQGRISQVTDPAGRSATYAYDSSGQLLLNVTTSAGTTSYSYTGDITGPRAFAVASVTTPAGTHAFFGYDSQGRLSSTQRDGGAQPITYSYDLASLRATDSKQRSVTFFYNDSFKLVRAIDPLGHEQVAQFDDSGNLIGVAEQGGGGASFSYDPQGNAIRQVDPMGAVQTVSFDPTFNNPTVFTDALGNQTTFTLDANGRTTLVSYPDGSSQQFNYDARGNLVRMVDRNGHVTNFTYDSRGLLLSRQLQDGSHTDYAYDTHANLISATDASGTIGMQYDAADRLAKITYPGGRSLSYAYDAGGRLSQRADQTGLAVNYSYDTVGRLQSLTDVHGSPIVTYTYDSDGQLTRKDNGNGTYTTYGYDDNLQLLHLINYVPDGTVNSRFDYTYDDLGRRNSVTTLDGTTNYTYDGDSRLTSVTLPNGRTLNYVYDPGGNRIGMTDNGVATAYTTNNLNEYTAVGPTTEYYDPAGNLTLRSDPTSNVSFSYDLLNRLVGVTGPSGNFSYEYDALGNRSAGVRGVKRTEYLVDPAGNLLAEYNGSGQPVAHYVYGLGLVSRIDAANGVAYYDFDTTGSTVGLTGVNGTYVNRYSYLPFGESLSTSESIPNPFRYVGAFGIRDDQNGLNFMRARYYSASQGRFIQPDPAGLAGATNLYAYADNNPVNEADPSGLQVNPLAGSVNPLAASLPGEALAATIPAEALAATIPAEALAATAVSPMAVEISPLAVEVAAPINWVGVSPLATEVAAPFGQAFVGGAQEQIIQAALNAEYARQMALVAQAAKVTSTAVLRSLIYARLASTAYIGLALIVAQNGTSLKSFILTGDLAPCLPEFILPRFAQTCQPVPNLPFILGGQSKTEQVSNSMDPNFVSGPGGFGSANFIPGATPNMPYYIAFENQPTAKGPAAQVVVTETLDPSLDPATFHLGTMGFGNFTINVPAGRQVYKTRVDARNSLGLFVDVSAALNGQVVTWTFTSIDPATQNIPIDPSVGFLPPDKVPPQGDGFVNYFVRPRAGLPSGTEIDAQASVVFDFNAPVMTNVFVNKLAISGPTSHVNALPAVETSPTFTVSWSGTDVGGPGIATFDIYVSTDGGAFQPFLTGTTTTSTTFTGAVGHTYGFFSAATDNVGLHEAVRNSADTTTRVGSSDTTPPVTIAMVSPLPNANGWNNSDVTITLNSTDNETGGTGVKQIRLAATGAQTITSAVVTGATASVIISTEGTTTLSFFGTDNAGNVESVKMLTIKLDKTPPTITGSRSPAPNQFGWNNSDVTVSFACSDSLSGLAAGSPPANTAVSTEGAGQSITGTCTDLAGNSASATVSNINIDKTPPTIAGSRTPPPNAHGWNNTNVTVSFACSDSLSGLAPGSPPADTVVSTEAAGQSVQGTCFDRAGNSASATVGSINIDKTPPTIVGTRTPPPNQYGWNNTDVTVSFICADSLSGVASCGPIPQVITTEGANQSRTGVATDLAGNTATATVSGINIDKTPPTVTCSATPNALWPPNHKLVNVTTNVTVTDSLSGPAGFELLSVTSNEPDSGNGDIVGWLIGTPSTAGQLRAERLGRGNGRVYTFDYQGMDKAGNSASCETTVVVPHDQSNQQ